MSYTSLPVAKWTHKSMLKLHDQMWSHYLKVILLDSDDRYTKEEKNKRINENLVWYQLISDSCINGRLTIKK